MKGKTNLTKSCIARSAYIMTRTKLKPGDKPTAVQLDRIEKAAKRPVTQDPDSPVYTFEQLAYLYAESKRRNIKQTIGIRLNRKTIEQYKNLGKGYTGVMAAVLDYAIAHPEVLKKAL
jgi:uncharacterized protein (DUF4415 family)